MSLKAKTDPFHLPFSKQERIFFLLLTIIAGIFILWPLHNFQNYLSQGDHGRDLYCFKKTMEGALPYRDYSWLFGPLMPYYYSIFYALGGVSIQSVLVGYILLILLTGVFVYLTCSVFFSPAMSFVCALWYWCFRGIEFFYTYNHIGGLLTLIAALYCVFKYIRDNRLFYVYAGFICIFLLTLIRLNMGIANLIAITFAFYLVDFVQKNPESSKKRFLYAYLFLATLTITFSIYLFLLYPLPDYAIQQSFPYAKFQRTDFSPTPFAAVVLAFQMIISYFSATLAQKILGILILLSIYQSCIQVFSNKTSQKYKNNLILIFSSLFIVIFFSSHEFIASGVYYRLHWMKPIIFILLFILIIVATKNIHSKIIKSLIFLTLFLPPVLNNYNDHLRTRSLKNPSHLLKIGPNKIYTSQHPFWFHTVTSAINFIKKNVPPSDKILVLPFDVLYLFLSDRDSAARQLVFFEHINITAEQEQKTISEMEDGNGNWVIISNRSISHEPGMGIFGKTYCRLLSKYIDNNFTVVAEFGDWVNPPGWAWNHGVRILKRNL